MVGSPKDKEDTITYIDKDSEDDRALNEISMAKSNPQIDQVNLKEMHELHFGEAKLSLNVSHLRAQCLNNHFKHDQINKHKEGLNTVGEQHITCWSENNTSCETVVVGYDKFGNCLRNG